MATLYTHYFGAKQASNGSVSFTIPELTNDNTDPNLPFKGIVGVYFRYTSNNNSGGWKPMFSPTTPDGDNFSFTFLDRELGITTNSPHPVDYVVNVFK